MRSVIPVALTAISATLGTVSPLGLPNPIKLALVALAAAVIGWLSEFLLTIFKRAIRA